LAQEQVAEEVILIEQLPVRNMLDDLIFFDYD
jgi:hypothetical protein